MSMGRHFFSKASSANLIKYLPILLRTLLGVSLKIKNSRRLLMVLVLLCGANSDLFGRRLFLLFGNVLCMLGMLLSATAHSHEQFIGEFRGLESRHS